MTSTKERQRAAARARLEREMAQRAAAAKKRRRQFQIIGAGVALLIVAVGTVWIVAAAGDDKTTPGSDTSAAPVACKWIEVPKDQQTKQTVDVGLPPTTSPPNTGTKTMAVTTNFGTVNVTLDLAKSPCAAESFAYLASKNFFNGTKCHRMFTGMLQCGDPSAKGKGYRETDGTGGPSYRFGNEYLPTNERPAYPAGVVALANSGSPDSNGSQFFFIYQDVELSPDYTILGKVDQAGLDVLKKATEKGHDGAFDPNPGGGHPKSDIDLQTVTVS